MNAKQRCKLRRLERRSEERNSANAERRLANKISATLSGCSERTVKALSLPTPVVRGEEEVTGSICLPEVAMYNAGYRNTSTLSAR
ncbi:transcriptional regulator [Obesumbacterium proteus]|uniref:transcriptional antitermination N peptide n=1 Tax=Obesumbacterium proteus TaxID=82983 RepID=UPI0009080036|nr:transcriptional regulator [Obesumbacterium proteus]